MSIQRPRPVLLNVQQVAKQYGVAKRTVWRWEAQGKIPLGVRMTATIVRWRAVDIQRHLKSLVPGKVK